MTKVVSLKQLLRNSPKGTAKFEGQIIKCDARELLKALPANSIDLTVTSPPYDDLRDYTKQAIWDFDVFKNIAQELLRVTKPGSVVVWVVGDKTANANKSLTSFRQALYFQEIGFKIFDIIIYDKTGSGPPHPGRYFNTFEYMLILSKGKMKTVNLLRDKVNKWAGMETYGEVTRREKDGTLTKKGRKTIQPLGIRTNIWRYNNGKGFTTRDKAAHLHPAIFPEKLVDDHIKSWSNEGDLVLDFFGGSGTTAKVAQLLKRRWIYGEIVKEYCEIAAKRLDKLPLAML